MAVSGLAAAALAREITMLNLFVFEKFPKLETERLRMRELFAYDAEPLYENLRKPEIAEAVGVTPFPSMAHAQHAIKKYRERFTKKQSIRWVYTLKSTGDVIGMGSLQAITPPHLRAELAYEIDQNYWRQGYGAEAARAILNFGFSEMKLHRIEAITEPSNEASRALLEKVGFTYEGTLRARYFRNGKFLDDSYYGLLVTDWEALSAGDH
ncbi:MAG: GNAT family protein [Chloroflexota bacterium]